jgi:C4-dicarboxylate transporter, DctM subunit
VLFRSVITYSLIACITLGKVAVPEMKKNNYNDGFAAASVVCGASLASLIPPSIGFILFGMLTQTSVGKLYVAGIIPGIILMVLMVVLIGFWANLRKGIAPAGKRTGLKEKIVSLKSVWAIVIIFVTGVLGIYLGIFTPTEGGAIGTAASIIVGLISKRLNGKKLKDSILDTAQTTAMIVLLVSGAYVFMKVMTLSNIPLTLAHFIAGLQVSKYIIIAFIVAIYIIFGMFSDIMACILLTVPIIFPLMTALGFDPLFFGVLVVLLIEIGFISPPIGMNVFMLSGINKIPINDIFKNSWPFLALLMLFCIILIIFPQIATWLPSTM